jgi:GTP:adenosylcobinamide-phosphate guanylyltransferase
VLVAGGRPAENNPLYPLTQGAPKALLRVGGRTLIDHVLNALRGSQHIETIVIVGLNNYEGLSHSADLVFLPDQGGLMANGFAGLKWLDENQNGSDHILLCSSDIPAITTPIVDEFIKRCLPFEFEVYYSLVTRQDMENRFPDSQRTFIKLQDMEVAGGDMFIANPHLAQSNRQLLDDLAMGRKQAWKIAKIVGPKTLLKFFLRRLTVKDIEVVATNYINAPVRVIVFPYAEIAMDVDKPHHAELLDSDLL